MKKYLALIWPLLIAAMLGGCAGSTIKDDLAAVRTEDAAVIVVDWADLMQKRYPAKTVFKMQGMGDIGKALAGELRGRGFGVIDIEQQQTDSKPVLVEVRSDQMDDAGVLVSLVIEGRIISRSYSKGEEGILANSAFSVTEETP